MNMYHLLEIMYNYYNDLATWNHDKVTDVKDIYYRQIGSVKEEYGMYYFKNITLSDSYGSGYYNKAGQPYAFPTRYSYSNIINCHIEPYSSNALLSSTIYGYNNTTLKYWLFSSKSGTYNLSMYYHIIGY